MTTIPTPAEFLASSEPDEEYDDPHPHPIDHPLYLIAQSLQRMADANGPAAPCTECEEMRSIAAVRTEQRDKIRDELLPAAESRATSADALIEEIQGIVKKSTSQVSLAVKAAIEAWRNPAGAAEQSGPETPSPAPDAPAVDEAAAGPLVQAPELDVPQASAGEGLPQPAADADVSDWRTYARHLGHGRTGPAFNELEAMNRSQIRTLLGIEHPVTPAGA